MSKVRTAKRVKTKPALNALQHGIRTARVLPAEQPAYEAHSADLKASLAPKDYLEELLVERVALCLWRLQRLTVWEGALMKGNMQGARLESLLQDREVSDEEAGVLSEAQVNRLTRYEAHLERSMYRALHELEALQSRREGRAAPLARVEVHGLPEEGAM